MKTIENFYVEIDKTATPPKAINVYGLTADNEKIKIINITDINIDIPDTSYDILLEPKLKLETNNFIANIGYFEN